MSNTQKLTAQEIEVFYYLDLLRNENARLSMYRYYITTKFPGIDNDKADDLVFLWQEVSSRYDTYESVEITEDEGKVIIN